MASSKSSPPLRKASGKQSAASKPRGYPGKTVAGSSLRQLHALFPEAFHPLEVGVDVDVGHQSLPDAVV